MALDVQFERDRVRRVLRSRLFGAEAAPARLGRFEVRARIGQGATGVVYRAHDPKLAREVALKLLGGVPGKRLMTRLESEGRALARLSHPNVVQIYDVGEHDGEVFLAMQLVTGPDLRGWLAEKRRTEAEIVDVLLDAARGLTAAHQEGLIHRDFKPENVLVSERGALVADFGLAALTNLEQAPAGLASALGTTPAGTPGYMAPEQWGGGTVDARADQYAFGVVALEALSGAHAPLGDRQPPTEERLTQALRSVSRDFRPIVARALAREPSGRFETMEALGAALAHARSARSRRWRALGLTGGTLALGALSATAWTLTAPAPCPSVEDRWLGVWDAERAGRIEAAFGATGLPFASRAFETTRAALDAYRAEWLDAHQDICEATAVRHEQSEPLLDVRMSCLERARQAVEAAADVLDDADATTVIRASRVVSELPRPEACRRAEHDAAAPVPDELATDIEQRLARGRAALSAGRFADGAVEAEAATLASSEAPALEAEARVLLGRLHHEAGDYSAAEASLVRGIAVAIAAPHARAAAAGSVALVETYAVGLSRYADAEHWAALADAHLGGLDDGAALRADLMLARGELYRNLSRQRDAVRALTDAVELHRQAYGEDSPRLAMAMTRLGVAMNDPAGCALVAEARALRERVLGEGHPDLGESYDRLANCALAANDPERAAELHGRALSLRRSVLGPEHRDVARSCFNFAFLRLLEDRLDESQELYECARRGYALAQNRHFEAASLIGIADIRMRQGRLDDAVPLLASAGEIYRETVPREHGSVARLETQLGRLALLRRYAPEARAHYDEAVRISRATREAGAEAMSLEGAGRAALMLGEVAEARALFEAGLAVLPAAGDPSPAASATLRFRLAQARFAEDPASAAEVRASVAAIRAEVAEAPSAWSAGSTLAEIDAWLAVPTGGAIGVGRSHFTGDGYGALHPR